MFPWFWIWTPRLNLPWSGDVKQDIEPTTSWFFRGIRPGSGDAAIEQQAFDVASYGRQLGLITEVLIDLAERAGATSPRAVEALEQLQQVKAAIDRIKAAECTRRVADVASLVSEMRRRGGSDFAELSRTLRPLLEGTDASPS
jgi:hypothetical protein